MHLETDKACYILLFDYEYPMFIYFLYRELEKIRSCIENLFSHTCGSASGSLISELVRRVFSDPFPFQPDCSVHEMPSTSSSVDPIAGFLSSATTTPSFGVGSSEGPRSRPHRVVGESSSGETSTLSNLSVLSKLYVLVLALLNMLWLL